ncbi:MAG: Rdx family protein, partial [Candidatus Hydrothermarchaeaceae archaeon]
RDAFRDDVEVSIDPGSTGIFDVYVGEELVFSKYKELRSPGLDEIKAIVENKIAAIEAPA